MSITSAILELIGIATVLILAGATAEAYARWRVRRALRRASKVAP